MALLKLLVYCNFWQGGFSDFSGCFFSTAVGGLRSFENPKSKITAVPAEEEEIWGATFKVMSYWHYCNLIKGFSLSSLVLVTINCLFQPAIKHRSFFGINRAVRLGWTNFNHTYITLHWIWHSDMTIWWGEISGGRASSCCSQRVEVWKIFLLRLRY